MHVRSELWSRVFEVTSERTVVTADELREAVGVEPCSAEDEVLRDVVAAMCERGWLTHHNGEYIATAPEWVSPEKRAALRR